MPREKNPDIVQAQAWVMASAVSAPSGGGTSTSAPQHLRKEACKDCDVMRSTQKRWAIAPRCWEPMAVHGVRS